MTGFAITRMRWQRGLTALTRRVCAWLAIVGILVHASLPLLHAPRAAAATIDDTVVICSGFGVKVVQLAELGGTDKSPQHSRIYYCPICLAQQMAGAAVLPDGVPLAAPSLVGDASFLARAEIVVATRFYSSLRARAPPDAA